ncbi:creatininase family protein [[Clostridium] symbiosum]|nr:creatininase family protein [[Clostridium] symbiosum]MCB6929711.1 creatininase family protein [[Clostridium] symbiosum]
MCLHLFFRKRWQRHEDFLLVVNPDYPMEWFTETEPTESGLLDIHAGVFETAVLNYFYPQLVDLETAEMLKSTSLDQAKLQKWLQGGEETKNTVPLGYTGNPAGYKDISHHVEDMICLQVDDIAKKINEFISKK